jgi:hypothetical protein
VLSRPGNPNRSRLGGGASRSPIFYLLCHYLFGYTGNSLGKIRNNPN